MNPITTITSILARRKNRPAAVARIEALRAQVLAHEKKCA